MDLSDDFGGDLLDDEEPVVTTGVDGSWTWAWEQGGVHGLDERILSVVSVGTDAVALHYNEKPMHWFKYAVDGDVIVDAPGRGGRPAYERPVEPFAGLVLASGTFKASGMAWDPRLGHQYDGGFLGPMNCVCGLWISVHGCDPSVVEGRACFRAPARADFERGECPNLTDQDEFLCGRVTKSGGARFGPARIVGCEAFADEGPQVTM
ncbi:DUF6461 domain-containing protein [Streptomyces toxytricini]|uniref:DUF6461 domain-containing protein n=1 Tax=Streptomyces toxytricini TaxID=67369 RepID=UPI003432B52A